MRITKKLLLVPVLLCCTGCFTASRMNLSASTIDFPASMSESFYSADDRLVLSGDYDAVYHFRLVYKRFAVNGYLPPKKIDMSDTLKTMLSKNNGDAIVNLKVKVQRGGGEAGFYLLSFLFGLPTLTLFSPSKIEAVVEGDIVRMKENVSFAAPLQTLLVFGGNHNNPYIKKVF